MLRINLNKGLYEDETMSHGKLIDTSGNRARINVIYWNRYELLYNFLQKNAEKSLTGQQVIDKMYSIESEFPMIFGED